MLLYIKDNRKEQKSILDYTQNYLRELIPSTFCKIPHFENISQHKLIMMQQRHAIQRHSINAWQGKKCYFSVPEPEMKMFL